MPHRTEFAPHAHTTALASPHECPIPSARGLGLGAALLLGAILAGCAHAPLNAPLARYDTAGGYRVTPMLDQIPPGQLSVLLFFSGGGTRAAAFSYGVLQELARTDLPGGGRMLDRVEVISAVSGGSFPAAYYCLYGDRVFQDFETAFLKRDVQDALARRVLSPVNGPRLASPCFARSDLAAEYYDRILFHGATFADLARPPTPRPFLMINATDMDSSVHFPFTQDTFDLIGSDISSYPLSRAVAASSAVPVVLTPVTLKNYAGRLALPKSLALLPAEANTGAYNRRQQAVAALARSYLNAGNRPYIHLLDGGLADNLGLSNLLAEVAISGGWDALLRRNAARQTAHFAIIVVDASTDTECEWGRHRETPGLISVVSALGKSTSSRTNDLLLGLLAESLDDWKRTCAPGEQQPQVHLINVAFARLADPTERTFFGHVPTTFKLPPATIDHLVQAGGRLLREEPEFRALLSALESSPANTPSTVR